MKKGIKYALVFTGGVAVGVGFCGANLISYALSDYYIREGLKKKISRKIDSVLYEKKPRRRTGSVSYRQFAEERCKKNHERFLYDEIVFETRDSAEEVLSIIKDTADKYGYVTLADMYELSNITAPYTSSKYGWTNIQKAEVKRVHNGYIINLPLAIPIE